MSFVAEAFASLWQALPRALGQLAWIGLWAALAWLPGRALFGRLGFAGRAEAVALPVAAGLALYGGAFFLLAWMGIFGPASVGLTVAGAQAAGALVLRGGGSRNGRAEAVVRPPAAAAAALSGLVLLPLLVLTLYPPHLSDDVAYHLPYARSLWETGAPAFLPELRFPVFPQHQEALWSPLLAGLGPAGPAGLVLLQTWLAALVLYAWGRQRGSWPAGLAAAALWLGGPSILLHGTVAFVDVPTALFVVAGFFSLDRFRATGDARWLLPAGAFAGAASATKYFGLFFTGVLLALAAYETLRRRRPGALAACAAAAAVIAAPAYLWIGVTTGNPLFPLLPELFGPNEWSLEPALVPPLERGDLLRLPAQLTLLPGEHHGPPPFTGALLVALPLLLLPSVRGRLAGLGLPALAGIAFTLVWLTAIRDPRYLFPAVALWCVPLGLAVEAGLERWVGWGTPARRAAALLVVLGLASPGLAYAVYRLAVLGPVPRGAAEREIFLAERVQGYAALAELERRRDGRYTLYALGSSELQYFARGRLLGDALGPYRHGLVTPLLSDPDALHGRLSGWGADHFLWIAIGRREPVDRLAAAPGFELLRRDARTALFRLTDRSPPTARPPPPPPAPPASAGSGG